MPGAIEMALGVAPYAFTAVVIALAVEATFDFNPYVGGFWLRFLSSAALFGYWYVARQIGCLWGMGSTALVAVLILGSLFYRSAAVSGRMRGRWAWNIVLIGGVGGAWLLLYPCIDSAFVG